MVKILPRRIYKYPLNTMIGLQELELPEDVRPLSVDYLDGQLVMWADVSVAGSDGTMRVFMFDIVFTGEAPPQPQKLWQFIGTAVSPKGTVFHVFIAKKLIPGETVEV